MTGWVIRFDHFNNVTTCPKGGTFKFKEKSETSASGTQAKAQWVTINCDGVATHNRKQGVATFEKNVRLLRDDNEVRADRARAYIDPKTRRVQRAIATGKKVTLFSKKEYAVGTRLVWNYQRKQAVLTGSPQAVLYQPKRVVRADEVHFNQRTRESSARGNILIERREGQANEKPRNR